ncbi:putative galectin, carbohydrate recognition domain, glycosyl transferase, family 31 [Helianthus annuus]|uniref:Hexosyltransferase n=1 Tax=Helianthus annuus TaxID=4232 RepID=A0A251TNX9_HELAN|nr:putative galectin, carbohydrate recognition domain, glycosyl transferase, family 31 [Helianthus annuus]KAJ0880159.1 putative galectin, carbohydrate recognition domain, glycosyl transferase, family 31 [Helianthus annuus]KAJ0920467.1 putative galectin, carbohydrate recognition domain, glycosyl transferase, family 31 [Helianthus annuus]
MYKKLARHAYEIVGRISGRRSGNQSMVSGEELTKGDRIMFLPCGLAAGSSITVVGTPNYAHKEYVPQLARIKGCDPMVLVSQFKVELQGLKYVVAEDPPKILLLNPRLRGDWSHQPVIEHNTCYRMQWGRLRVDGFPRCENWMRNDVVDSKESRTSSWFKRFIARAQKHEMTWPFPFVEGKLFVLTIRAINAGGRHVTSFPYRTLFLPLAIASSNCECFICDDDTFTRVDTVLKELKRVPQQRSLYMGNLNLYHRPLRHGKWAVSFEEWPEAVYPPYANGPGYIIGLYVPGYNFR